MNDLKRSRAQKGMTEITHPQTGKPLKIKASTTVAFRPTTALKERVEPKTKAKAKQK